MKKVVRILLAILMVACLALSVTACKSDCDKGIHVWDEGTVTENATCTKEGVKTFKCTKCDHGVKTEPIAKLAHTPVSADVAPTCTQDGVEDATKCSVCNTPIQQGSKVDKLGHDVTAWTVCSDDDTKHEGTCTRQGCNEKVVEAHTPNAEGTECTKCHKVLGGEQPPHEHDYEGQPWQLDETTGKHYQVCKDTTCTVRNEHEPNRWTYDGAENKHIHTCNVTGCNLVSERHDAVWGDFVEKIDGQNTVHEHTCTKCPQTQSHSFYWQEWKAEGELHVRHCSDEECNLTQSHTANMGEWTPAQNNQHEKVCNESVCDFKETGAHKPVVVNGKPATCTEAGKKDGSKCSDCNAVLEEGAEIDPLGHDFQVDNWTTGDGKHWHECKRNGCNEKKDVGVHSYADHALSCTVCGNPKEGVNFVLSYANNEVVVEKGFEKLVDAIAYATNDLPIGTPVTIAMGTIEGSTVRESTGIKIGKDKDGNDVRGLNITINFKGKNYCVSKDFVGSEGTETNGFQILAGNTVTLKNGTISVKENVGGIHILIQNYADLTLDNITIDGENLTPKSDKSYCYALSNNCGNVSLTNATHIIASANRGVALDVWYNMGGWYAKGVHVNVGPKSTINGVIEYGSAQANVENLAEKATLALPVLQVGSYNIRYSGNITDCSAVGITIDGVRITHKPAGEYEHELVEGEHKHYQVCTLCNGKVYSACEWDEGKVTTQATCSAPQVTTYTCAICKGTKEVQGELAPDNHDWDDGEVTTQANCVTKQVTTYTCKDCGETKLVEGDVDSTKHNYSTGYTSISAEQHAHKCTLCTDQNAYAGAEDHTYDNNVCECKREITVAEIWTLLKDLANGDSNDNGTFKLVGKVKSIDIAYNAEYNNVSITIVINENGKDYEFYCYRVSDTDDFKGNLICVDDVVTLTDCGLSDYKGTDEVVDAQLTGYVGAECEITLTNTDNATIDGIENGAKVERYTTVEFTVTAKEGWRVDSVKANGVELTVGDDGKYSVAVNSDTEITLELVDANAPAKHQVSDSLEITADNIGITNRYVDTETTKDFSLNGVSITFGWKNLYKDAGMQFNGSKNSKDSSLYNKTAIVGLKSISFNVLSGSGTLVVTVATDIVFTKTNSKELTSVNGVYIVPAGYTFFKIAETGGYAKKIGPITIVTESTCAMEGITARSYQAETCTEKGNIAYWECDTCHKYFADERLVTEITDKNSVDIAPGHKLGDLVTATDPDCATETDGHVAYYECSVCHKYFEDDQAVKEIEDITVAYKHTLGKVDRIAPTSTTEGKQEYWKCSVCDACFEDEQGVTKIANIDEWGIIPATGDCEHGEGNTPTYKLNDDGTHCKICSICGGEYGLCDGMKEDGTKGSLITANDDGTHDFICEICEALIENEACRYNDNGVCVVCGYHKNSEITVNITVADGLTVTVNIADKQNLENGTKISLAKGAEVAIEVAGEGITYEITLDGTKLDGTAFTPSKDAHTLSITVSKKATATTVTQETFTAVNGKLNGDENVSYASAKGGGTSAPAVNGGEIRLYQNSSGTGGGTITISIAEGKKIKSITIGSSMDTSISYTTSANATKSTTESLAKNKTYTLTCDDNITSVTFYCMGTSSSSRLYVNYLSVVYE